MPIEDCRTRKWMITQMNPDDHDISKQGIIDKLTSSKMFEYLCASDEITQDGTPHVHCYVKFTNPVKFSI